MRETEPITDPSVRPAFHLAICVDDLEQAAAFYGGVTMFFYDPAGNALEFKAFADESQLFAF